MSLSLMIWDIKLLYLQLKGLSVSINQVVIDSEIWYNLYMLGEIEKNKTPLSAYSPPREVVDLTIQVKKDYAEGVRILERPWHELNDRSVIDDENLGKNMFNAFVDTSIEDPNEAWQWRGTRSTARNKGIALHANLTANYLLPLFIAQNENDEIDRDFSEVMQDIVEWMAQPINSNYQSSFIQIAFG